MDRRDLAEIAINLMDTNCYMLDIDTYEILFINDSTRKLLQVGESEALTGLKCYTLLHGKSSPCEFCVNSRLKEGEFYCEECFNESVGKYLTFRNTRLSLDGRAVRLTFCTDLSESYGKVHDMELQLTVEQAAMECIHTLVSEKDIETAIRRLLSIVAGFYGAERGYIVEFRPRDQVMDNTYEWCREGIPPEKDKLQNLPLCIIDRWMTEFKKKGAFFISALQEETSPGSDEYRILEDQGISSLIAAPMIRDGEFVGFIGVDNPTLHMEHSPLIQMLTSFVLEELEKRKLMAELERMSYYDALSGASNRNRYIKVIEALQETPPSKLGILYADINGLKKANDTYGHERGDYIIQSAAKLLQSCFDGELFRIGGDEFVSINIGIEHDDFEDRVNRLKALLDEETSFGISFGISWQEQGKDSLRQIANADEMMYLDKQNYYKRLSEGKRSHRSGMVRQLMREIENDVFVVYLQPKVNLQSRWIIGAEALVRKKDGRGGVIPPDKFIPIYEEDALIQYIDFFVLRTICSLQKAWRREGLYIPISVNLSRVTLMQYDVVNMVKEVCEEYGISPNLIALEVTESSSEMGTDLLLRMADSFKKEGFILSLDDFGSQYSNLSILSTLDFDEIKLDKSLIDHLGENPRSDIIVEHTIDMCRSFRRTLSLAEGIETPEQEEILKRFHCDYGQGFLFSKPLPIEDFKALYQNQGYQTF